LTKRIAIIVEGATEKIFKAVLQNYLSKRLSVPLPRLKFISEGGRIPTGVKLKRDVRHLLDQQYDAVIALTDVYTGTVPPEFKNAADAKKKMRRWVPAEPRFHPHAAQFEFEAWLLPYWNTIQRLSGTSRTPLSATPETINHDKPPSKHLAEVFLSGRRRAYVKTRDGAAILRGQDLDVSANACPELRAFLDTILRESAAP
jgi:Domain of unknown function (DUF4276)